MDFGDIRLIDIKGSTTFDEWDAKVAGEQTRSEYYKTQSVLNSVKKGLVDFNEVRRGRSNSGLTDQEKATKNEYINYYNWRVDEQAQQFFSRFADANRHYEKYQLEEAGYTGQSVHLHADRQDIAGAHSVYTQEAKENAFVVDSAELIAGMLKHIASIQNMRDAQESKREHYEQAIREYGEGSMQANFAYQQYMIEPERYIVEQISSLDASVNDYVHAAKGANIVEEAGRFFEEWLAQKHQVAFSIDDLANAIEAGDAGAITHLVSHNAAPAKPATPTEETLGKEIQFYLNGIMHQHDYVMAKRDALYAEELIYEHQVNLVGRDNADTENYRLKLDQAWEGHLCDSQDLREMMDHYRNWANERSGLEQAMVAFDARSNRDAAAGQTFNSFYSDLAAFEDKRSAEINVTLTNRVYDRDAIGEQIAYNKAREEAIAAQESKVEEAYSALRSNGIAGFAGLREEIDNSHQLQKEFYPERAESYENPHINMKARGVYFSDSLLAVAESFVADYQKFVEGKTNIDTLEKHFDEFGELLQLRTDKKYGKAEFAIREMDSFFNSWTSSLTGEKMDYADFRTFVTHMNNLDQHHKEYKGYVARDRQSEAIKQQLHMQVKQDVANIYNFGKSRDVLNLSEQFIALWSQRTLGEAKNFEQLYAGL